MPFCFIMAYSLFLKMLHASFQSQLGPVEVAALIVLTTQTGVLTNLNEFRKNSVSVLM